jgi:integrase/recombinase XerD
MRTLPHGPRSLPFGQWPSPDRILWQQAVRPVGFFDDENIAAAWSEETRRMTEQGYGCWLAWLNRTGILDPGRPPGDRVFADLFLQFIDDLGREVSPVSVFTCVSRIKRMLEAIAPSHDWGWITAVCRKLKRAAIPVRQKHLRVVDSSELYALGLQVLDAAETWHSIFAATQARDGLIISLLAARPLRIGNFAAIELGRHLQWTADSYWLVFDKSETKNSRPIEVHCPDDLGPHIERYREVYRPMLLARATPALETPRLWINRDGQVMAAQAIRRQIEMHTRRAFGRHINPHLFRDCAATSIAIRDPEHVRIAPAILGHARLSTTEKYYNQAQMLTAAREHNREILNLRKKARSLRARRPRKA